MKRTNRFISWSTRHSRKSNKRFSFRSSTNAFNQAYFKRDRSDPLLLKRYCYQDAHALDDRDPSELVEERIWNGKEDGIDRMTVRPGISKGCLIAWKPVTSISMLGWSSLWLMEGKWKREKEETALMRFVAWSRLQTTCHTSKLSSFFFWNGGKSSIFSKQRLV